MAETWTPAHEALPVLPKRSLGTALWRGMTGRCPECGQGRLFGRFLKVVDRCESCGEAFHHHRSDDLPPYITIVIVGHIVIPMVLLVERVWSPADWVQLAIWVPVTLILSLLLMQPVKGAVVGLQWANYMHGFHPHPAADLDPTYRELDETARGG